MYTIKRAAELTGVPVATLRAWERRYGVISPQRTHSGYRLYDERALSTITEIRDLVNTGCTPSRAAIVVQQRLAEPPRPQEATPAGGAVSPEIEELVQAAADLDTAKLTQLLDDHLSRGSFEIVVSGWLMPALAEVGREWAAGRLSVAGEHLIANAVTRRLATAFDAASRDPQGPRAIIGLPPGCRHELGILAFATAARRLGVAATYLGADLPAEEWATAAAHHQANCAVLALSRAEDLTGLTAVLRELERVGSTIPVAVGGRYQHLAPSGVERLGHDIPAAAVQLVAILHTGSNRDSGSFSAPGSQGQPE